MRISEFLKNEDVRYGFLEFGKNLSTMFRIGQDFVLLVFPIFASVGVWQLINNDADFLLTSPPSTMVLGLLMLVSYAIVSAFDLYDDSGRHFVAMWCGFLMCYPLAGLAYIGNMDAVLLMFGLSFACLGAAYTDEFAMWLVDVLDRAKYKQNHARHANSDNQQYDNQPL